MKISVYILLILCLAGPAGAVKWHVSHTGNNSNDGLTLGNAKKTLAYCITNNASWDTLCLANDSLWSENNANQAGELGAYCTLPINFSGTSGHPKVIRNVPGYGIPKIVGSGQLVWTGSAFTNSALNFLSNASYVYVESLEVKNSHRGITMFSFNDYNHVWWCIVDSTTGENNGGFNTQSDFDTHYYNSVCYNTFFHNWETIAAGVEQNAAGILTYQCRACTLTYNTIYDEAIGHAMVYLKAFGNYDNVVAYNTLYGGGYTASNGTHGVGIIDMYEGNNNQIHHNIITNCDLGIAVHGSRSIYNPTQRTKIYNNTIYGGVAQLGGIGYFHNGTLGTDESNDLIYLQVFNNIVRTNDYSIFRQRYNPSGQMDSLYEDYNSYYNSSSSSVVEWHDYVAGYDSIFTLTTWQTHYPNMVDMVRPFVLDANSVVYDPDFLSTDSSNANFMYLDTTNSSNATLLTGGRGGSWPSYMGARDPGVTPPEDTTPPVISSVSANPSTTAVVITWTTDEAATSRVIGDVTSYSSSLVTSHSRTISGLTPATGYDYQVVSCDASGNCDTSATYNFTTDSETGGGGSASGQAVLVKP